MKIVQKYIYILLFAASADQAITDKYPVLEPRLAQMIEQYVMHGIVCYPCSESYSGSYDDYVNLNNFIPGLSHLLTYKKNELISRLPKSDFFRTIFIEKFSQSSQEEREQILNDFFILCNEHTDFFQAFIKQLLNYTGPQKDIQKLFIHELSRKKYTLEHLFESAKKELLKPILHLIQEHKRLKEEFKKFVKNYNESISSHHVSKSEKDQRQTIKRSTCFNQFVKALQKEKELIKQGYICFYHGQMRDYAVMSDLGNILFNTLASRQAQPDFYFMQFRKSDFDHVKQFRAGQKKLPTIIAEIKKEQASMLIDRTEPYRHPWRLSLNIFAFGNCNNWGSNTFNFVETNSNINTSKNIFKLSCDNFNIPEAISLKYEPRMRDLIQKYNTLYSTGRLILFAFPAAKVDTYTYIATVGAYRYVPYLKNRYIGCVTDLLDVAQKQTLSFDDLDHLEFATPLTPVGALNPYKGIKLFVFENEQCDKQLEQQLHAERQALINDLITDLKQHNLLKECQQIAKEFDKLLKMCV